MATKSVSKHTNLKVLLAIQANQYRGKHKGDYWAFEIDQMIIKKQSEHAERETKRMIKDFNEAA
jgi:hypothetical protein